MKYLLLVSGFLLTINHLTIHASDFDQINQKDKQSQECNTAEDNNPNTDVKNDNADSLYADEDGFLYSHIHNDQLT